MTSSKMPSRARSALAALLGAAFTASLGGVHAGCGGRDPAATTLLAGPGGVAVAGAQADRAFIANRGTDSVQVLQLQPNLPDADFVPAPARYFPLQLAVGPEPTEIAAAGAGRYVFVLDGLSGEVSAIDAIDLRVIQNANGLRLRLPVGDVSAQARSLLGDPRAECSGTQLPSAGPCLARAFVALKAMGSVVEVQLRRADDGTYALVLEHSAAIGGEPQALAMGDGNALFVTDDASPTLVRLPLPFGAAGSSGAERFALGGVGGAVAATANAVAVARPATGDVVVLAAPMGQSESASTAALGVRDADPTFAPLPRCLLPCDAVGDGCRSAHPADQALCLSPNGYEQPVGALPYGAVSLRGHPQALAALDANAAGGPFVTHCVGAAATASYAGGFAVASVNGAVEFIGLDDDAQPTLVDIGFCQPPTLANVEGALVALQEVLDACPAAPARRRFACASDEATAAGAAEPAAATSAPPGVLVLRGRDGEKVGLLWEGVLPQGDGSDNQAAVDDANVVRRRLRDALDFSNVALLRPLEVNALGEVVHIGDVFEVVSKPTFSEACQAELEGTGEACTLERRVVGLVDATASTTPSGLVLDHPLPRACFPNALNYRLRAGDTFLAGRLQANGQIAPNTLARVAPGERYGPAETGRTELPVSFAIRADLPIDATLSACERYGADGRALNASVAWRNRMGYTAGQVRDPARSLQLAAAYDGSGRMVRQLGFMPHALAFTPASSPGGVQLIVSFAGSNAVYLSQARSSYDFFGEAHQRNSRLLTN